MLNQPAVTIKTYNDIDAAVLLHPAVIGIGVTFPIPYVVIGAIPAILRGFHHMPMLVAVPLASIEVNVTFPRRISLLVVSECRIWRTSGSAKRSIVIPVEVLVRAGGGVNPAEWAEQP
jgi:hypothetical protein